MSEHGLWADRLEMAVWKALKAWREYSDGRHHEHDPPERTEMIDAMDALSKELESKP